MAKHIQNGFVKTFSCPYKPQNGHSNIINNNNNPVKVKVTNGEAKVTSSDDHGQTDTPLPSQIYDPHYLAETNSKTYREVPEGGMLYGDYLQVSLLQFLNDIYDIFFVGRLTSCWDVKCQ